MGGDCQCKKAPSRGLVEKSTNFVGRDFYQCTALSALRDGVRPPQARDQRERSGRRVLASLWLHAKPNRLSPCRRRGHFGLASDRYLVRLVWPAKGASVVSCPPGVARLVSQGRGEEWAHLNPRFFIRRFGNGSDANRGQAIKNGCRGLAQSAQAGYFPTMLAHWMP